MKKKPQAKDGAAPKAKAKPTAKAKKQPVTPPVLSDREQAFIEYYLISLNATEAAIKAGYAASTADGKAWSWVGKCRDDCPPPKRHVWDAVQDAIQARAERNQVDADYVLKRLVNEVEADLADLYDDDNNLLPINKWPLIWRQGLVAGMEVDEIFADSGEGRQHIGYTKKLKLSDRAQRLVSIGRHIKVQAFKDASSVEGSIRLEDFVLSKTKARTV